LNSTCAHPANWLGARWCLWLAAQANRAILAPRAATDQGDHALKASVVSQKFLS
jgi:hypothetical protein